MLRQLRLRCSGHLVQMDDKRLPKRLFHEDVARGSRQVRRSKDTLKTSLKRLQVNPANWNDLDRPTGRKTAKTNAAIYEASRISAAKIIAQLANPNCAHLASPTLNHPLPVPAAS
nr:unnamed protein product [Spirometra erinaceieuropaei]